MAAKLEERNIVLAPIDENTGGSGGLRQCYRVTEINLIRGLLVKVMVEAFRLRLGQQIEPLGRY